jgi:hypothetical protein
MKKTWMVWFPWLGEKRLYLFGVGRKRRYPENLGLGRCSFCSTDSEHIQAIHSGPDELRMCDECLRIATQEIMAHSRVQKSVSQGQCSFCSEDGAEVDRLVAGPNVQICNECVNRFSRQ